MDVYEGQTIDGLFKVTKKGFKKGGAGEIHLAKDPQGRAVVLKFLIEGGATVNLDQFKREYQTLLKFSHPNVARVYHFGEHGGRFFIVYEYVEGKEFGEAVQGLSVDQKDLLLIKVLEALEAIHMEGMMHLDIKPSNILVTDNLNVKLIDFGLAIAREEMDPKHICGSPQNMTPEMIFKKGVDNRADLFQFGVLGYYAHAHYYPFRQREYVVREFVTQGKDLSKNKKALFEKLKDVIAEEASPRNLTKMNIECKSYHDDIFLKCLEHDPANRFGSARAAINALKSHHPEDYEETPEARGSYLIPQGDKHIGRIKEQKMIYEAFRELTAGKQPQNAVFWIYGAEGMGKSHFLKKAKEVMEKVIENVSIHFLEIPKGDCFPRTFFRKCGVAMTKSGGEDTDWLNEWCDCLNQKLMDNKKPLVVFIDNLDHAEDDPSPRSGREGEALSDSASAKSGRMLRGPAKLGLDPALPLEGATLAPTKTKLGDMLVNLLDSLKKRKENEKLFLENMPVMLCLSANKKDEKTDKYRTACPDAAEITLKPLSKKELASFLSKTPALRHKEIPEKWVEAVYNRTEGNPNEIVALLKEQDRKGFLLDFDQEVLLAHVEDTSIDFGDEEEKTIPPTTETRLEGVFSGLSEVEQRIVSWVALWCWKGVLQSVKRDELEALLSGNHILPVLHLLVSKKVLHHDAENDAYSFQKYSFWPNLVHRHLEPSVRAKMHQQVCAYLKTRHPHHDAYFDAILLHQAYGTSKRDVWKAALALGRKYLFEKGQAAFAQGLFERAMEMIPKEDHKLHLFFTAKRIEACFYAGRYDEALTLYRLAKDSVEKDSLPPVLRIMLATSLLPVLFEKRLLKKAAQIIDEGMSLCAVLKAPYWKSVLLNAKAYLLYKKFYSEESENSGLLEEAKKIYEESECLERSFNPHQRTLIRNNNLGVLLHTLGDNYFAISKLEAKHRRLKQNPNIFIEMTILATLAESYRILRDFAKAFGYANKALEAAKRTNQGKWVLHAHHILANIHYTQGASLMAEGKIKEAEQQLKQSLKEHGCCLAANSCLEGREEAQLNTIGTFICRGQCCEKLGEWGLACDNFSAALYAKPVGKYLCLSFLGLCRCAMERGDTVKADSYLEKAEGLLAGLPQNIARHCSFEVYKTASKLFLRKEENDKASEYLAKMELLVNGDRELEEDFKLFEKEFFRHGAPYHIGRDRPHAAGR